MKTESHAEAAQPKAGHTPGPWRVEDEFIFSATGFRVADTTAHEEDDMPDAEAEANARLIAAAPELLAALENAASELKRAAYLFAAAQGEYAGGAARQNRSLVSDINRVESQARAAIAKATP